MLQCLTLGHILREGFRLDPWTGRGFWCWRLEDWSLAGDGWCFDECRTL